MKQKLRYLIPVGVKKNCKYSYYSLLDAKDYLTGKQDKNYPPRRLNFVGSHDFKKVGDEFLEHFKTVGQLKPDEAVLDIGCGIGRMALPLTKYLNEKAIYRGFDIDKRGIKWCNENISPRHPNFEFQYVDLYNKFYNKKGKLKAYDFVFPYEAGTFDFAFATSVFTHLLPDDAQNYLKQIKRSLKPDGRAFVTFFILDKTSEAHMKQAGSNALFSYEHEQDEACFYSHKTNPEAEIAYSQEWLLRNAEKAGFKSADIHPGTWSGREGLSYQDIVILS